MVGGVDHVGDLRQGRDICLMSVYLPHGKPDTILSKLGLDADGITDEVLAWVRSSADQPR